MSCLPSEQTPLLSGPSAPVSVPNHNLSHFPSSLRNKRILLCTESFGPVNGVSRTTLMLVTHLRTQGAHVAVVAPHTRETSFLPDPTTIANVSANPELRINGYPLPFNPELSIVYPVRISALIRRAWGSDAPPDLIYLASPASLGFQVMLQVRQQPTELQIPIMCNFQTDLSGYCDILFPWPLNNLATFAFDSVQSYLFRHSSVKTVFYPSHFVRRYLERQGVQDTKMDVIRRGVKADVFRPDLRSEQLRARLAPNGEIILICISRLAGEKGYGFLANVAKELHRRGLAFTLYIVGGNVNPQVENEIHNLFEPLKANGRVVFAGIHRGHDLSVDYASGDIFLHCSITETFGLVVLEAMASGVPVIARDEGGPSEIITHGSDGYLVPPDDLTGFVERIQSLAIDKQLGAKMALRARETACNATWENINNKVAWRMADVIAEREANLATIAQAKITKETSKSTPRSLVRRNLTEPRNIVSQILSRPSIVRSGLGLTGLLTACLINARLASSLSIILWFWFMTSIFLAFTEAVLWARARHPKWYGAISSLPRLRSDKPKDNASSSIDSQTVAANGLAGCSSQRV